MVPRLLRDAEAVRESAETQQASALVSTWATRCGLLWAWGPAKPQAAELFPVNFNSFKQQLHPDNPG